MKKTITCSHQWLTNLDDDPIAVGAPIEQLAFYYDRHHAWVRRYFGKRCRSIHDAEDLTHDLFVRLASWLTERRAISSPRGWLIWHAVHLDLNRRTVQRRCADKYERLTQTLCCMKRPSNRSIEEKIAVRDAVRVLPRRERVSVVGYLRGETSSETAAALGTSDVKIRQARARGIRRLRKQLHHPWILFLALLSAIAAGVFVRPAAVVRASERVVERLRAFIGLAIEGGAPRIELFPPSRSRRAPIHPDILTRSELDVRLVLRLAEADLYDAIQISRTDRAVRVHGFAAVDQLLAVDQRLKAVPHVSVDLRGASAGHDAPPASDAILSWLNLRSQLPAARTSFASALTARMTSVTGRLDALGAVAQRYPGPDVDRLSDVARGTFDRLVDLHHDGLRRDLHTLDMRFAELFGAATSRCLATRTPADWRHRSDAAREHAASLESQLRASFRAPTPPLDGTPGLRRTLDHLWSAVHCPLAPAALPAGGGEQR